MLGGSSGRSNDSTMMLDKAGVAKPMLGRYQVEKELGKGAMGVVYLGQGPEDQPRCGDQDHGACSGV